MPKYEISIALHKDDNPLPSKNEGDIVSAKEYPATWGKKILDGWLIVIVETTAQYSTMRWLAKQRIMWDKVTGRTITHDDYDAYTVDPVTGRHSSEFEVYRKNRFTLPFATISAEVPGVDLAKVRNRKYKYQPFKSATHLASVFDGKEGRYLINKSEIDASISALSAVGQDDEVVIDLDTKPIIIDHFKAKTVTCISLEAEVSDGI